MSVKAEQAQRRRRTFAEQIQDLTFRHARRTTTLTTQLTDIALFLGGRAGARLAGRLAVTTGRDTQLRLIRALPVPSSGLVPRLGVDEFAVRRGRTYATVLVDMDTRRPVDVLADRTANTFAAWLRNHPEVRTICRDRVGSFRDGASTGAPQAQQVADAWHLLHNLAEAVERVVGRHRADLREPLTVREDQDDALRSAAAGSNELDVHGRPRLLVAQTRECHQQIHELIERGNSLRTIARELHLSRGTVLRLARAANVEQLLIAATHRPSVIDDYRRYLHHRWMEGCTNAAALTREIQQLGYLVTSTLSAEVDNALRLAGLLLHTPAGVSRARLRSARCSPPPPRTSGGQPRGVTYAERFMSSSPQPRGVGRGACSRQSPNRTRLRSLGGQPPPNMVAAAHFASYSPHPQGSTALGGPPHRPLLPARAGVSRRC
ncbi:transposase [Kitasatospora sp. NPDC059088]|uniref:transposase n=1 Tax=Kitasatospora sp. NPDC059088 TaxID=3346722 RepID=UPI0036CDC9FE